MSHEQSNDIGDLAKALAGAQAELEGAKKTSVNPHFRTKYADLSACWEAIRETLPAHGLSVVQTLGFSDGRTIVTTQLMHASGQWIRGSCPIRPVKDDPQGMGSAITYGRRYGLAAIVGLTQDDDDGQAASSPKTNNKEQRRQRPHPTEAPAHRPMPEVRNIEDAIRLFPKIHARTPLEPDDFASKTEWRGVPISEAYGWQDAAIDLAKSRGFKNLNDQERAFAVWAKDLKSKRESKKGAAA